MESNEINERLRESEERYQHLVHMLPDGLIIFCEGYIVFANRTLLSIFGVSRLDEIIGHPMNEFVHPEFLELFPVNINYLIRDANPSKFINYKLLRLNQEPFEVELRAVEVMFEGKQAVQLIIRDISNRIRMEASLHEKDFLYKSLMENVVAGVFVGQKNNIVYANPYLADMFGYSEKELLMISLIDLMSEDEVNRIQNEVMQSMANGNIQFPLKFKGKKKDGTPIYVEGNSSLIMLDGLPSLLGTVQDVTFKREKEKLLRDSAKLYQKMIKFVPEPIVISDEGIIVYANKLALQLIGLDEESQVINRSLFEFIHPSQHSATLETVHNIMSSDDATPFQERIIVRSEGQFMDVEISSIRINNYMGKDVMLSVIRDLTDRKRSEEVLIRSEKLSAIGQLAAGVAHEIRNPLTALKGFTQLLSARYPEQPQYFDIMANEIDRITLIVNEFMTLAKPHFTQFNYEPLEPILQSVLSILETQAILLNVELKVCFDHTRPMIFCNADQLRQVFLNLIKNALEAMPQGGEVVLTVATTDDGKVQIRIKDGGIGIPEELIKKIGEPFVTTKEKGTGLGIMISTRIIEAHKGTLRISSVINEGTVVEIILPVQEQEESKS
ncbi:PAS domain S-box protein [Paenibacillus sp. LHD-38]|uniref:PAS domain S-box protein n=1 Tax=Paenibacillus sp. LHD-38 TaxID=3072143 RepID=UPI00280D222A|nr:PAS domain S-box protein [Paenibacillus sp. LHD-38]MDQ8736098.1 PAS domain S-box protein [Paenibacillus sp. LHD-38]